MSPRPCRRQALIGASMLVAIGLAGCDAPPPADAGAEPTNPPRAGKATSLHLDQTVEARTRGENPARKVYLQNIALCREAGAALVELGPEEVQRAGTARLQLWIGESSAAYRVEHFEPVRQGGGPGPSCHYYLASRGVHAYFDQQRSIRIDLATDARHEGPPDPAGFVWQRASGAGTDDPEDGDARRVAGQPCIPGEHPAFPGVSYCAWSAGHGWGFATPRAPFSGSDLDDPFRASIVLEQDPGQSPGAHYHVTTQALEVGGAVDESMTPRPASAWPAAKARP